MLDLAGRLAALLVLRLDELGISLALFGGLSLLKGEIVSRLISLAAKERKEGRVCVCVEVGNRRGATRACAYHCER